MSRSPTVYFGIQRLRPSRRYLLVTKDTEIVIEGYPRSANTFAVAAFLVAQGLPVKPITCMCRLRSSRLYGGAFLPLY